MASVRKRHGATAAETSEARQDRARAGQGGNYISIRFSIGDGYLTDRWSCAPHHLIIVIIVAKVIISMAIRSPTITVVQIITCNDPASRVRTHRQTHLLAMMGAGLF
eukprot:COSAG06_NODE_544_length_14458_cov_18.391671_8_plen_107_part_00